MNGSYFLGNQSFEVRPLPDQQPGPGCVRVRVAACGVCGTDVHIYHGGKGSADVKPPVVLGHEFSGVVEALGPGVNTLALGDHVTVDPNMYCGKCHYCRIGKKRASSLWREPERRLCRDLRGQAGAVLSPVPLRPPEVWGHDRAFGLRRPWH